MSGATSAATTTAASSIATSDQPGANFIVANQPTKLAAA